MKNVFKIEKINREYNIAVVAWLCVNNIDEYYQGNHDVFEWAAVEYKETEQEQKKIIANRFGVHINTIELIY